MFDPHPTNTHLAKCGFITVQTPGSQKQGTRPQKLGGCGDITTHLQTSRESNPKTTLLTDMTDWMIKQDIKLISYCNEEHLVFLFHKFLAEEDLPLGDHTISEIQRKHHICTQIK